MYSRDYLNTRLRKIYTYRSLVDAEDILAHARQVFVVMRPAEDRPDGGSIGKEGSLLLAWQNVPDHQTLLVRAEIGTRVASDEITLARREVDALDTPLTESGLLGKLRTTPQCDSQFVERGQICAQRRPLHVTLRPTLETEGKQRDYHLDYYSLAAIPLLTLHRLHYVIIVKSWFHKKHIIVI